MNRVLDSEKLFWKLFFETRFVSQTAFTDGHGFLDIEYSIEYSNHSSICINPFYPCLSVFQKTISKTA